ATHAHSLRRELVKGNGIKPTKNIFSFAAMWYKMLSGRKAFAAGNRARTLTAVLRDQPAPLRSLRHDVPAMLERIVERCLQKDPRQRYASAVELQRDLSMRAVARSSTAGMVQSVLRSR